MKEPVMETAFSFRLWRSLFLIILHVFTINSNELSVIESVFSIRLWGSLKEDSMKESSREFAFSFRLWRILFLVKLQAFMMNSCFGRIIKLFLIQSVAMNWKKKNIWSNRNVCAFSTMENLGRSKPLMLKT